nr:hypothetical protein [Candidatus Sigynarchaeota archaeon]
MLPACEERGIDPLKPSREQVRGDAITKKQHDVLWLSLATAAMVILGLVASSFLGPKVLILAFGPP